MRSLAVDESGAAAVEFAMVVSVFVSFIIGIAYVGIMLFNDTTLQWAVDSGARVAAINTAATQSQISSAINGYLSSVGAPAATVQYSVAYSGTMPVASIAANFSQSYTIPFISTFHITFSASTSVPQGT